MVRELRDLFLIHKAITHLEKSTMKGVEIDAWQEKAEKFLGYSISLISKMLDNPTKT
jgi:hypothetical protein